MVIDCHIHLRFKRFGKLKKELMAEDTPEREGWFLSLATRYRKHNVKRCATAVTLMARALRLSPSLRMLVLSSERRWWRCIKQATTEIF